jgi:hypothetical protein
LKSRLEASADATKPVCTGSPRLGRRGGGMGGRRARGRGVEPPGWRRYRWPPRLGRRGGGVEGRRARGRGVGPPGWRRYRWPPRPYWRGGGVEGGVRAGAALGRQDGGATSGLPAWVGAAVAWRGGVRAGAALSRQDGGATGGLPTRTGAALQVAAGWVVGRDGSDTGGWPPGRMFLPFLAVFWRNMYACDASIIKRGGLKIARCIPLENVYVAYGEMGRAQRERVIDDSVPGYC